LKKPGSFKQEGGKRKKSMVGPTKEEREREKFNTSLSRGENILFLYPKPNLKKWQMRGGKEEKSLLHLT